MSPPRNYVTTPAVSAAAEVKSAREYPDARITKVSSAPFSSERVVRSLQISSGPSYFTFVRIHERRRRSSSPLIVFENDLPLTSPLHMLPSLFFINFSTHVRYFRPPVLAAHGGTRTFAIMPLFWQHAPVYSRVTFFCFVFLFLFFFNIVFSFLFDADLRFEISRWVNQGAPINMFLVFLFSLWFNEERKREIL